MFCRRSGVIAPSLSRIGESWPTNFVALSKEHYRFASLISDVVGMKSCMCCLLHRLFRCRFCFTCLLWELDIKRNLNYASDHLAIKKARWKCMHWNQKSTSLIMQTWTEYARTESLKGHLGLLKKQSFLNTWSRHSYKQTIDKTKYVSYFQPWFITTISLFLTFSLQPPGQWRLTVARYACCFLWPMGKWAMGNYKQQRTLKPRQPDKYDGWEQDSGDECSAWLFPAVLLVYFVT